MYKHLVICDNLYFSFFFMKIHRLVYRRYLKATWHSNKARLFYRGSDAQHPVIHTDELDENIIHLL